MKFDLATVVFDKEYPMIELQARSIAQHIKLNIEKIFLIVNSDTMPTVDKNWYGKFADCVEILHVDQLVINPCNAGYCKQQIAKINIFAKSNSDIIIILDNKNWFINDVNKEKIVNNKLLAGEVNNVDSQWISAWNLAFDHFKLDSTTFEQYSALTPFIVRRETLEKLSLTANVEQLIAENHCTEFALITAAIVETHGNWHNYFFKYHDFNYATCVWPGYSQDIDDVFAHLYGHIYNNSAKLLCTGCHRYVWKSLTDCEKKSLATQWERQGFFNQAKGVDIINCMIKLNPEL